MSEAKFSIRELKPGEAKNPDTDFFRGDYNCWMTCDRRGSIVDEQRRHFRITPQPQPESEEQGFHDFATQQGEWSQTTFGTDKERGPLGPLKHLIKEANECLANPKDVTEFADCLFLVLDAARRAGFDSRKLLDAAWKKLAINKAREWPKPGDMNAAVEHVKESAEQGDPAAEAAGVEPGWRLLEPDERVKRGDEYSGDGGKTWDLSMNYLKEYGEDDRQDSMYIYRRRTPDPESVAVVGLSDNERAQLSQLREVVVPNLTKVCDDRWKQIQEMDTQLAELKRANAELSQQNAQLQQYKTLFSNALDCVDQVFQGVGMCQPTLPDYAKLGEDKFKSVIRLARDFKELTAERDEARKKLAEAHERELQLTQELTSAKLDCCQLPAKLAELKDTPAVQVEEWRELTDADKGKRLMVKYSDHGSSVDDEEPCLMIYHGIMERGDYILEDVEEKDITFWSHCRVKVGVNHD